MHPSLRSGWSSGFALRLVLPFDQATSGHYTIHLSYLREPVEDTLCPSRHSVSRLREAASYTPGQRRHLVAGTGVAICPVTPLLVAQGERRTDPAISPALDGLKYSRLSRSSRLSTALRFGRHFSRKNDTVALALNRRLSPQGFALPHSQEGTGAPSAIY